MTTIPSYGYGALATQSADGTFRSLKTQLTDLQTQLSTGKKAATYAGLGADAIKSLSGRATLASIEAYASNLQDAKLRLNVMSTGIGQIDKIARSLTVSLSDNYESTPVGQTSAIVSAEDGMKQVLDILGSQINGRYLYAGRAATQDPVVSYGLIVNGDATRAGLRQMIAERREADLGPDGLGRLTLSDTATGVTVSEEAAGLPFGMKIEAASATGTALTASVAGGAATLAVAAQPGAGESVSLSLKLPDGSTTKLTFTAGGDSANGNLGFAIGADAAETTANLQNAVRAAIGEIAREKLPAASALGASQAFFAGSPNDPPLRVAGPPYATATATVPGTAADTVIWYRGDDAAGSARETAPVRTGDTSSVALGARANEPGFQAVLAALGALVGQDFPAGSSDAQRLYAATADAVADSLGDGVQSILVDFSVASASLTTASNRLGIARNQVADTLAGIEDADPNEVAVKLLATQTRLQASYQTTSAISKLSLVNFL